MASLPARAVCFRAFDVVAEETCRIHVLGGHMFRVKLNRENGVVSNTAESLDDPVVRYDLDNHFRTGLRDCLMMGTVNL